MTRLDTTILGGLPVTVEISIAPRDPDVGIFEPYVEDWCIVLVDGKRKHHSFITALTRSVCAKEPDFETRLMEEYNDP